MPLNLETLQVIFPFALAMAFVGLLESLMTAKLVDDVTDTHSLKTREAWGQGVANIVTGFFGGMGGCAMIGQTMINVKAPARVPGFPPSSPACSCLSWWWPSAICVADPDGGAGRRHDLCFDRDLRLAQHPPATLKMMPKSETIVMVATVISTVATDNLAIGVLSA